MIQRLSLYLVVAILAVPSAAWADDPAGTVEQVQAEAHANAQRPPSRRLLQREDAVFDGETLTTGDTARLLVVLTGGTTLTLGANAVFTLDELVNPPAGHSHAFSLALETGAFLLRSGPETHLQVTTPVATIGIRGTEFWGELSADSLDVFLLEGVIEVRNEAGSQTLDTPGTGTSIALTPSRHQQGDATTLQWQPAAPVASPPSPPTVWEAERVTRAVATITFAAP